MIRTQLLNGCPAGIREFRTLLRALADSGTTVFLSSHLLGEVEQVCDRAVVLHEGRVIGQGPVVELAGQAGLEEAFLAMTGRGAGDAAAAG